MTKQQTYTRIHYIIRLLFTWCNWQNCHGLHCCLIVCEENTTLDIVVSGDNPKVNNVFDMQRLVFTGVPIAYILCILL